MSKYTPLFVTVVAVLALGCSPSVPNIADSRCEDLVFSSPDRSLNNIFKWACKGSESNVRSADDPVGPWYESALGGREAFCMRDVSHQSIGEQINGHSSQNLNMMQRFWENISESKDYCTYWEINRYNQPAPADYVSDHDFWYNLNANFDVLQACYRLYLWTGDSSYIDSPDFDEFASLSLSEYIDRWLLGPDELLSRPICVNVDTTLTERQFDSHVRGLPSYNEAVSGFNMSSDLIASIYRAMRSYAEILRLRGEDEAATEYDLRADEYGTHINGEWWDEQEHDYYSYHLATGEMKHYDGGAAWPLWFGVTDCPDRVNAVLDVMAGIEHNVESMSYYPMIFYRYGQSERAYRCIQGLYAAERCDYPEVASGIIEAMVSGLAGVQPDASKGIVSTLPALCAETPWVAVENVPVFDGKVSVVHSSPDEVSSATAQPEGPVATESQFVNKTSATITWRAAFPGKAKSINGEEPKYYVNGAGLTVSYLDITAEPGILMHAEVEY